MSVADRLNKLSTDITNAYTSIENKGGTIPSNKNTNNLPTAIDSIEVIEQQTAEGESLSLTNTKAMPYSDYVVKGKSEQEGGKTKNFLNSLGLTTQTINGVTFTPVYENNSLQYININGTATDRADYKFVNYVTYNPNTYDLQKINTNSAISILLVTKGGSVVKGASVTKNTFTITENTECLCWIRIYSGTTINNEKIYPQVKLSSITDDTYEPYGEKPSPSNPSEIHSVADDVNLFDASKIANSSIVVSDNGKTIIMPLFTSAGGYTSTNKKLSELCPELKAGEVAYLHFIKNIIGIYNNYIYLVGSNRAWQKDSYATITEDDLNSTVILYGNDYSHGETEQLIITDFKIQKGSTATPYSPYNQGTVTIKQRGKNLFNTSNIISNVTDYTITVQDGGFIIRTGGMSNGAYFGLLKDLCPNLKVGDKFKFTWNSNATRNNTNVNYIYLRLYSNTIRKDITYTCTQEMLDSETYFYGQQGEYYKNIMFYLEGQTSDYEPYQANDYTIQTSPLRSLPNGVKDTIEAEQHRKIGRRLLQASDIYDIVTTGTIPYVRIEKGSTLGMVSGTFANDTARMKSYKITGNVNYANTNNGEFNTYWDRFYLAIFDNRFTDLATAKQLLEGEEIIYELATEVIEPLTQNQATTMLDIIKTGSYEGTTNIYTDEDIKPTMKVEYYKKG